MPASLAARHTTVCLDSHKNSQAVKKGAALKNLGEISYEIKGGGQQMAAMLLAAIFDFITFFTQVFKGRTFFHSLAVFVRISVVFVIASSKASVYGWP